MTNKIFNRKYFGGDTETCKQKTSIDHSITTRVNNKELEVNIWVSFSSNRPIHQSKWSYGYYQELADICIICQGDADSINIKRYNGLNDINIPFDITSEYGTEDDIIENKRVVKQWELLVSGCIKDNEIIKYNGPNSLLNIFGSVIGKIPQDTRILLERGIIKVVPSERNKKIKVSICSTQKLVGILKKGFIHPREISTYYNEFMETITIDIDTGYILRRE